MPSLHKRLPESLSPRRVQVACSVQTRSHTKRVRKRTSSHAALVQDVVVHEAGSVDHLRDLGQPPLLLRQVAAGTSSLVNGQRSSR